MRNYHVVVFGDSILWGQGCAEEHKIYTLIANHIPRIYNNAQVNIDVHAHSGAIIGVDKPSDVKPPFKYGEVPNSYPSIIQQVMDYPPEKAANTDLVLVDGGINDLEVVNILFDGPTPDNPHPDDAHPTETWKRTKTVFGNDMKILLRDYVIPKFPSSRTRIMVTGYYKIVSEFTDIGVFRSLGFALGAKVKDAAGDVGGLVVGAVAGLLALISGLITDKILKDRAVLNCQKFYDTSVSLTQQVIRELDPTGLKIFYTSLNLPEPFAVFQDGSYLWGKQPFLGLPWSDDEMRLERAKYCAKEPPGIIDDFKCKEAGIGHPNAQYGTGRYADSIISRLFPTPAPCRAMEKKYEDLVSELMSLQKEILDTEHGLRQVLRLEYQKKYEEPKVAFNSLSTCKRDYYNNNGQSNVGSLLEIVRARGWTVKPISIRQVSQVLGLVSPVSLRHI